MFVAECKCEACERPYPAPSIGPTIDHRICGKCQIAAVVWAAKQACREVKLNELLLCTRLLNQESVDLGKLTLDPSPAVMDPSLLNVPISVITSQDNAAEGPRQKMWQLFHQCWAQAQESKTYDKGKWLALEKELLGTKTLREEIVGLAKQTMPGCQHSAQAEYDEARAKSGLIGDAGKLVNFREFL